MPLSPISKAFHRFRMRNHQRGVGMLEVMIALVLLTTTLLGATALQLTGMQTNRGAYYRTQASVLAYDIAERIRINSSYALTSNVNYSIDTTSIAIPSSPNCISTTSGCASADIASHDIREWAEGFIDVAGEGNDGASYKAILPNGTGTVTASGASFVIEITWDELDWNVGGGVNKADTTKNFSLDFTLTN